jgi:hypothetical protein
VEVLMGKFINPTTVAMTKTRPRARNRKRPGAVVRGDVTYVPLSGNALKLVEDLAREMNSTPADILGQSVSLYKMAIDARNGNATDARVAADSYGGR